MNKIVEKNIQNPNNTLAGISKLFNVGYKEIGEEEETSGTHGRVLRQGLACFIVRSNTNLT